MTDRAAREQWSAAHGSIDPDSSIWISGWLTIVHRLTAPLAARHVPPGRVTAAGLVVSAAVPLLAWCGAGWPLLAVPVVVLAGLLDGIDGALARADGSASAWGSVLDDLADRCSDLLMIAALALLGAPAWLCVAGGALTLLLESVRASARSAGLVGIGALTVWERPSRIIVVAFASGLCGIAALLGTSADGWIATGAAGIAALLAAVSFVHLTVAVRRQLRADGVTPGRRAR